MQENEMLARATASTTETQADRMQRLRRERDQREMARFREHNGIKTPPAVEGPTFTPTAVNATPITPSRIVWPSQAPKAAKPAKAKRELPMDEASVAKRKASAAKAQATRAHKLASAAAIAEFKKFEAAVWNDFHNTNEGFEADGEQEEWETESREVEASGTWGSHLDNFTKLLAHSLNVTVDGGEPMPAADVFRFDSRTGKLFVLGRPVYSNEHDIHWECADHLALDSEGDVINIRIAA
jgi:hypothetical protein